MKNSFFYQNFYFSEYQWYLAIYAIIVILSCAFITIVFKSFYFRRIVQMTKCFFDLKSGKSKNSISNFSAVMTSVATKVGTGNIIGIGYGIFIGGPGIMFWIWIFGIFLVGIAIAEAVLAQIYKQKDVEEKGMYVGGVSYYITNGLSKKFYFLAIIYAIISIFTKGFFIVTANINSIVYTSLFTISGENANLSDFFAPTPWIICLIIGLFIGFFILLKGVKGIINFSSKLAPIFIILYLIFALVIFFSYIQYFPDFFKIVFSSAFNSNGIIKGPLAASVFLIIIIGAQRSIFSNEAGQGSGTHAAASAKIDHPLKQGLAQGFGVLFDTLIFCSLSGFIFTIGLIVNYNGDLSQFANKFSDDTKIISNNSNFAGHTSEYFTWLTLQELFSWQIWGMNVGGIIISLFILYFAINCTLGGILIAEFNVLFLTKNLKNEALRYKIVILYRVIAMLACIFSPIIGRIGSSIFDMSDILVSISFMLNIFIIFLLLRPLLASIKDFLIQLKKNEYNIKKEFNFEPSKLNININYEKNQWKK
ncbi:alanine:cation symporter family protein [symbiont of Argiope bruennichi]|uniref:alanine:cation symporter family protein n=1 Tax=symbiont of Argiope bruennichi TaxID=2810479 RepID=UPI003DA32B7D